VKFLYGKRVWQEIKALVRQSRSLVAVVGFVGRRPSRLLRWPRKATVVADLSDARVREGATSARGALALVRKGVEVLSYPRLHSKVFLFDRHAVVGSMNLSEESQDRLEEAAAAGAVDHIFYADPLTPALKASGLR
jgi:phosphatidylserine/phosphatidylglycerophosphate/cardiolipin synthase-like enzyme